MSGQRPEHVGILAIEVYTPSWKVDQELLEDAHNVKGKYTIGLGQVAMACCNDREDVVSMALSAASSLLTKYSIDPVRIGRLEVGTESGVDRSKSIKSLLMELFKPSGNTNIEGVDSMHGCYGGTAALFNSVAWVESSAWDGRLALVVASDMALYPPDSSSCATGGCGAVALLIGPDAPLPLHPQWRSSYSCHAYEFFKPVSLGSLYPVVDGPATVTHFLTALDSCTAHLHRKLKLDTGLLDSVDWYISHAPFNKLIRKGLGRLLLQDMLRVPGKRNGSLEGIKWEGLDPDSLGVDSMQDKALEKALLLASQEVYNGKVQAGAEGQQLCGNCYTACLYTGLASLVEAQASSLVGQKILMYSFGSGVVASLFLLSARQPDCDEFTLSKIAEQLQFRERLERRTPIGVEAYEKHVADIKTGFGAAPFSPCGSVSHMAPGCFYLEAVDESGRRVYRQKPIVAEPLGSE